MQILVRTLSGRSITIDGLSSTATVLQLKKRIALEHNFPENQQKLIFAGRAMEDSETLAENQVQHQTSVMLVQTPPTLPTATTKNLSSEGTEERKEDIKPIVVGNVPPTAPTSGGILLYIRMLTGRSLELRCVKNSDKVVDVKGRIATEHGIPIAEQKLIYTGRALTDLETMESIGMENESSIMLVTAPVEINSKNSNAGQPPPPPGPPPVGVGVGSRAAGSISEPVRSRTVPLNVRTLAGATLTVEVPLSATFGEIKSRYLQLPPPRGAGFPAIQMRLIYAGAMMDDKKTPVDYNCTRETCIHLVRRPDETVLGELISESSLRANCKFCHTPGAEVQLRPVCGQCHGEAIMLAEGSVEIGRTRWGDLPSLRCQCFACGAKGPAAVGFLCHARVDGNKCPSRDPNNRRMTLTWQGGDTPLVPVLNVLYGYAHGGGYETRMCDSK